MDEEELSHDPVTQERAPTEPPHLRNRLGVVLGVLLVVALGASQLFLINSLQTANDQIQSLDAQIASLDSSVDDIATHLEDLATTAPVPSAETGGGSSSASDTPESYDPTAIPAGYLPRFTGEGPDQAVGMTLGAIEGADGYSESQLAVDPADGIKRVWMIWAHWCPYCQQELPILDAWWPEAEGNFPNVQLVSVTTSVDSSRGNPLDPYLESSQFTFPVVVDTQTQIAAQMGVTAFPFWIVTDGDGTVLYRTAGAMPIEQVEQLFSQLVQYDA